MRVFRICRADRTQFDGEGARIAGGRWNSPGLRLVYTAQTESLAILEMLVHLTEHQIPVNHFCVPAEVPGHLIEPLPERALPPDWRMQPAATAELGSQWIRSGKSAVLRVPSVIVPREWNYLISPSHPAFSAIKVHDRLPIEFDPRLWKN
jgi:RES domain-containing protein